MKVFAVARTAQAASDAARQRALDAVRGALPRVGVLDRGVYACDLRGTRRLLGAPLEVGRRIVALCERAGAGCAVGVAPGTFVARVLAEQTPLGEARELGTDPREFLAPLAIATLPLDARTVDELAVMGLRDVAAFAALDRGAVLDRLGRAAAAAHALACGMDDLPVHGVPPRRRIRAGRRFDEAIGSKEQLVFALRALADVVAARLRADGLAALRLVLHAEREAAPPLRLERLLLPPAADPAALVRSLRWALDELPHRSLASAGTPGYGPDLGRIEAAAIEALEVEPLRGRQLGLFAPDGAHAEEAIAVAQHLRGRLGAGAVLRARVQSPDARLPEREAEWTEVVA